MIQTAIRLRFEDARALLHLADSVEDLGKEELRAVKELRKKVEMQQKRLRRVVEDAHKMQEAGSLVPAGYEDAVAALGIMASNLSTVTSPSLKLRSKQTPL